MFRWHWILASAALAISQVSAGDIGFIEDFALAKDRLVPLKQLIPGTEDYYYYHCLHYLNTEQFDKAEQLTKPWHERFGQTARLTEIQTRFALLTYDKNPQRSLDYLKNKLGLYFNHKKEILGAAPNLPTTLDVNIISRQTLIRHTFNLDNGFDNFEESAFDWLAAMELDETKRRLLLQRMSRPDILNLPQLVVADLRARNSQGFGAFNIHRQLTAAQLEEALRLQPNLLNQTNFIQTSMVRLHPTADEDWRRDPVRTEAFLERLQAFVARLSPAHNSLKAHVLYHRLVLDRSRGNLNKDRFIEYLKLPRPMHYVAREWMEKDTNRRFPAQLNADYLSFTLMPAVGDDEPLVRGYLKHFLADAPSPVDFEPYINDLYLKQIFAETKIENGLGEPEQWASALSPEQFRALRERIDIDFALTNRTDFAGEEAVALDLFVKNVPTLIVKVFEINTRNWYRTHKTEINTDINLDGLVANEEQTHAFADAPLRRVAKRFDFPRLNKSGVYIVDFIGAGKSSRALIRKGRLRPIVSMSAAGQVFRIVDEANRKVVDAGILLGSQEYSADKDGTIAVPFSTNPALTPVVISRGDFSSLDTFVHQAESYQLAVGFHFDRESLLSRRTANLVIRPGVSINGIPTSVKLLENPRLQITSVDQDGIATTQDIPDIKLFEDRESIHELKTPARLASLSVVLRGKIKSLVTGKPIDVAATESFALNGIDKTEKIEDLHFAKFGGNWMLEVRGRTGESRADRPIQLSLKHRDFRQPVNAVLKTDAKGRADLGPLLDIVAVTATGPEGTAHSWTLPKDLHTFRQVLHSKAGEIVTLPYLGSSKEAVRAELALFELRGESIAVDRFESMTIVNGLIELKNLPAGDFDFWYKPANHKIRIRVVEGESADGWVLGRTRFMRLPALPPIQIESIVGGEADIAIQLRNASKFARVHVFATRYQPAFSAFADLSKVRDAELDGVYPAQAQTVYLAGRNIGDEYRYVIDRKYQKKYPGNMLERPSLLLNPWVVRQTETSEQVSAAGEAYGRSEAPKPSMAAPSPATTATTAEGGDFANLDFLAEAATVELNLLPDKDGIVRVPNKSIGSHAMIHVVAVDPLNTTVRSMTMPEKVSQFLDLRLANGLDPKGHFAQQKRISVLTKGQPLTLADIGAGRFEAYDTLARVHGLFAALSKDAKLAEFNFILNWPKLKPEEKRTMYSKYACHELSFYLSRKDPEFFNAAIKPYLSNKKDRTFLDRYLLEDDLSEFVKPWSYDRLNVVERILLANRIVGELPKTTRQLTDVFSLLPTNAERFATLFDTAIKAGSLETGDSLGFSKAKSSLEGKPAILSGAYGGAGGGRGGGPSAPGAAPEPAASLRLELGERDGAAREELSKSVDRPMRRAGRISMGKAAAADKKSEKAGKADDESRGDVSELKDAEKNRFFKAPEQRKQYAALYRRVDPTQEWAENNYYNLRIAEQTAELVAVNPFWLDFAKHDSKGPFLSRNLAEATHNFTEMMFALAVLDLPFEPAKHDTKFEGAKMTLTPGGSMIAFHEEINPAQPAAGQTPILVSQNFYRNGERYRTENGEQIDKFVTGEFVVQTVYGCQVVVTNPTSSKQKLTVLLQIPVGAMPLQNGQSTRTVLLNLEPYRTQTIDYLFYFPMPGQFAHFPVHVAKNEQTIASSAAFAFNVVAVPTKIDTQSWDYVSQNGTPEEVLAFLNRENVRSLNLDKIAFRMSDRGFFDATIKLLDDRHQFQNTLWSYAISHNALPAAREFLAHADSIVNECGGPISGPLLTNDPVARFAYEHLEYKPIVNARAHALGKRRQIVNDKQLEQYHRFMKLLSYRTNLNDSDLLAVTYYLLLQDRIEEALETFARVDAGKIQSRMQYDYCAAWLDFFGDSPTKARAIATKYANHPVDRWRNVFAAMLGQLDEIEGKPGAVTDLEDRDQRQAALAAKEPSFEFKVESQKIDLIWRNLNSVRVNYYLMDVELLFSHNPFVQQSGNQFSSIRPNDTKELALPAGQTKLSIPLPENLANKNVLVEIVAGGKSRSHSYYANAMYVRMLENYGQVLVTDAATNKAISMAYVKVYARLADGQVKFHKDGYTDHRGRFDYASVSTPEPTAIERFAILVLTDNKGASIRETAPPTR